MKEDNEIDQNLANVLSGTHTEQQEKDLEEWINQSKENKFEFLQLRRFWKTRTFDQKLINHEAVKSKLWAEIVGKEAEGHRVKEGFIPAYLWRVAAVVLMIIIPSLILIYTSKIYNNDRGAMVVSEVVKQNPAGQKSQIQLSDGSKVWLNAESSLSFNESFSDSIRAVRLVGEAFFEINHDNTRPFIVKTENLTVSVLGTHFNVSAYHDDNIVLVSLIQGSVKVNIDNEQLNQEIMLEPGIGVAYSKNEKSANEFSILEDQLLLKKITGWKNGILVFNGQDFQSFLKEISRWYDVQITVIGEPPRDWSIRGAFENEYLNNILNAISFNKDFSYELEGKELKIMFNN